MDVMRGNQILFMRTDEVEAAWHWSETILNVWEKTNQAVQLYPAGSWGPEDASMLIARDGRSWYHDDS